MNIPICLQTRKNPMLMPLFYPNHLKVRKKSVKENNDQKIKQCDFYSATRCRTYMRATASYGSATLPALSIRNTFIKEVVL